MSSGPAEATLRPAAAPVAGWRSLLWAPVVVLVCGATGILVARLAVPVARSRYFPWIIGRGLGLAAFAALAALVAAGLWARHPWRFRLGFPHPETTLRLHASLAAATLVLVAAHVTSLALDSYAGVGWIGVLLPGAATYRPTAVALGVAALWLFVAVSASVRLGARLVRRAWLPIHHLAMPMFAVTFAHGLLAGTDTPRLRIAYAVVGSAVVALWVSRRVARPVLDER